MSRLSKDRHYHPVTSFIYWATMKCRWQTGHLHKIKAKLTFIFFSFPLFKSTLINVNWKIFSKYSHAPTHPSLWTLDPLSISNTWSNRIKLSTHVAIDPLRPTKGEIAMGKFSTWQPIDNDLVVVVRLNCPNYKLGKLSLTWNGGCGHGWMCGPLLALPVFLCRSVTFCAHGTHDSPAKKFQRMGMGVMYLLRGGGRGALTV